MKEQKFEKVVEWKSVGLFYFGMFFNLLFGLSILLFDSHTPKTAGFVSGLLVCYGIMVCLDSVSERKVYWRRI